MSQQPPGPPPGQPPGQPMPPAPGGGAPYGGGGAGQPTDSQGRVLAHWWKRAVAGLIDGIIIGIPYTIIGVVLGVGTFASAECVVNEAGILECDAGPSFIVAWGISYLIYGVILTAYQTFFHGSEKGQTVGKMVMSLQIRDENTGGQVEYGKAALRGAVASALILFTCGIGSLLDALWPLWDPKRQALRDKAAGTVIIDLKP